MTLPTPPPTSHSSGITVSDVRQHLEEMTRVYVATKHLSEAGLHSYFCDIEEAYVLRNVSNFAHTVHMLHPRAYVTDHNRPPIKSVRNSLVCAHCQTPFDAHEAYDIHVHLIPVKCYSCKATTAFADLVVPLVVAKYNATAPSNPLPSTCRCWSDVHAALSTWYTENAVAPKLHEIAETYGKSLSLLNLDLVYGMYRQIEFIRKVCSNVYWRLNSSLAKAIVRYDQFISMASEPGPLVPTMDIDLVWHTHQCTGVAYSAFCMERLRRFVDHDDRVSPYAIRDDYARTYLRFGKKYGTPYSNFIPGYGAFCRAKETSVWSTKSMGAWAAIVMRAYQPGLSTPYTLDPIHAGLGIPVHIGGCRAGRGSNAPEGVADKALLSIRSMAYPRDVKTLNSKHVPGTTSQGKTVLYELTSRTSPYHKQYSTNGSGCGSGCGTGIGCGGGGCGGGCGGD